MSKKKPRPKRKYQKISGTSSTTSRAIMDRRALEKTMWDMSRILNERDFASIEEANAFLQDMLASGEMPVPPKVTPLEQAQDLMYEAWASSGRRRLELALRALDTSEDCADAYVFLAEEVAPTLAAAKELYEHGVKAGERALPPETFEEEVGHFWRVIETRPYMRARLGLAQCLQLLGERKQAIEHYTDMLRLNPNDNQGVRWILANCLLEEGEDEAVGELLARYEDDPSAVWMYSRALWMFRREGASKKANARLREALKRNPFVPAYVVGKKKLPRLLPEYISPGDESEAIAYAAEAIGVWTKTEGALEWLMNNLAKRPGGPGGQSVRG